MILHYNIYPDRSGVYGCGTVRFYLADCHPSFVIKASEKIRESIDKSIGVCNHAEWIYNLEHGQIRIDIALGALKELVDETMKSLQKELIDYYNLRYA